MPQNASATNQKVLVFDFGAQYGQLIARRVRDLKVYCDLKSCDMTVEQIKAYDPIGIIFTGGPNSVYDPASPHIDRAVLDALHAKYGEQLSFTSPLLHQPKFSGNAVWMMRCGSLLYVKVYRTILQLAEVIRAENDADVLYFVERLAGIFPPADYELHVEGEGGAALRKLLKGYYKRIVCE